MDNKKLITILVIVVILGVAGFFIWQKMNDDDNDNKRSERGQGGSASNTDYLDNVAELPGATPADVAIADTYNKPRFLGRGLGLLGRRKGGSGLFGRAKATGGLVKTAVSVRPRLFGRRK